MHPQQQDVVVTKGPGRGGRIQLEREAVAVALRQRVIAPGGSVEDDLLSGRKTEPLADVGRELVPPGVPQQVVAGIAGLHDLAVEAERPAEDRRAERVLCRQHVPAGRRPARIMSG